MSAVEPPGVGPRPSSTPRVVLPRRGETFAQRASRFAQLAAGHPMGDYLKLMGTLALAQHEVVAGGEPDAVDADALARARDYAMPPLSAVGHARTPQWRADLVALLARMIEIPEAKPICDAVGALDDDAIEALAERVLSSETLDTDAAAAPLVGAALQTYFTRTAAAIDVADVVNFNVFGVCPVCATRPVASVVHIDPDRERLRYCVCALCSTEWNVPRSQCTACDKNDQVHFLALTPHAAEAVDSDSAVSAAPDADVESAAAESAVKQARRAETCDTCRSYLKIFYRTHDQHVEAVADDLASLALDVAVAGRGYDRSGPNLLFHPGS